jgi:hypothetical protein
LFWIQSNSSSELCLNFYSKSIDPIQVINMKVSRNDLFYLLVKFHIFWRPLAIFLDLIIVLCWLEKVKRISEIISSLMGRTHNPLHHGPPGSLTLSSRPHMSGGLLPNPTPARLCLNRLCVPLRFHPLAAPAKTPPRSLVGLPLPLSEHTIWSGLAHSLSAMTRIGCHDDVHAEGACWSLRPDRAVPTTPEARAYLSLCPIVHRPPPPHRMLSAAGKQCLHLTNFLSGGCHRPQSPASLLPLR